MKILAIETHFPDQDSINAADWWRTIRPMQELQKRSGWDIEIRKGAISPFASEYPHGKDAEEEWLQIGRDYDLVFYSYNHNPIFHSYLSVVTKKFKHKMCIDYDDNVLQMDETNPTVLLERMNNPHESEFIEAVLMDVPYITVTNAYLKKEYSAFLQERGIKKPIYIIPNFIDLDVYKAPEEKRKSKYITIGFFGSTSHQEDLYDPAFHKAISFIQKKYKKVRFEIIGNFIPNYLDGVAHAKIIPGDRDFNKWIDIWKSNVCNWDIGVAPLRDTPFNRSRSVIKWHEYAAANIPMVASDIDLYNDKTVFRAKTADEWISALSLLIENKEYRLISGEKAFKKVQQTQTIQDNWDIWYEAIQQINNPS